MLKKLVKIGFITSILLMSFYFVGATGYIDAGLISYFPLNNNTLDISENNYHATLANGGFVEDHLGNQNSALYGSIKYPDSNIFVPNKFSVAMWLKMDYIDYNFSCFVGNEYTKGFGFGIIEGGTTICPAPTGVNRFFRIVIGNVSVNSTNATLSCEDGWKHVVITFDDDTDTVQIYLNGVLTDTLTNTGTMTPTGYPVSFGKDAKWGDTFYGSLDEIRFYNRVITAEEANELYTFDEVNTTLFLPHFDITDGFWKTSVMFFHLSNGSSRVEFSVWDNDGNISSSTGFDLVNGFSSYEFKLDEFLPTISDPTKNGWLQIKSNNSGLTGLMKFTFIPTGATSSLPLVSKVGYEVVLPLLEWSTEYKSGFAIVNTGNYNINVSLHLRDKNGNTIDEMKYKDIGPRSKIVMMLDSMFDSSAFQDQMSLVATCDDYPTITGFALTFNSDNTEIVAVPGTIFNY